MDEHKILKSTNRWLVFIIFVLILVVIGLARYIIYQNTIFNKNFIMNTEPTYRQEPYSNNQNEKTDGSIKTNEISQKQKIRNYNIKVNAEIGNEKEYTLDKYFKIKVKLTEVDDKIIHYQFSLNDSDYLYEDDAFIYNENQNELSLKFHGIGNYIAYENTGITDIRSTHLSVFDLNGNLYKTLYSFDEDSDEYDKDNPDIVIDSIDYVDKYLIIEASRINHGPSIIYKGTTHELDFTEKNDDIPSNLPVRTKYSFYIDNNGNIDFDNPKMDVIETFSQFYDDYKTIKKEVR